MNVARFVCMGLVVVFLSCGTDNGTNNDKQEMTWQVGIGTANDEEGYSIVVGRDDGIVVAGATHSLDQDNDVYIAKLDAAGDVLWQTAHGGTADDAAVSVAEAADGGYVVGGYTQSAGVGPSSMYLVKFDADGQYQWQRTYGGNGGETCWSVAVQPQGGLVLAGMTSSYGAGGADVYVVTTNASGQMEHQFLYGGADDDVGHSCVLTPEGGFVIGGYTKSSGSGGTDAYLLKADAGGVLQWETVLGSADEDEIHSVIHTSDGGYAAAGQTRKDNATRGADAWLMRFNTDGGTLWTRSFGGTNDDVARSVVQTADGSFIIAGTSLSFGQPVDDIYLAKFNASGDFQWEKFFDLHSFDNGYALALASGGGLVVGGTTRSIGHGGRDMYVARTDAMGEIESDGP